MYLEEATTDLDQAQILLGLGTYTKCETWTFETRKGDLGRIRKTVERYWGEYFVGGAWLRAGDYRTFDEAYDWVAFSIAQLYDEDLGNYHMETWRDNSFNQWEDRKAY